MPRTPAFALGLDFGTNSARALIVHVHTGRAAGSGVAHYPSGAEGVLTDSRDPNVARQNPADYAAALARCTRAALRAAKGVRGFAPERIVGIGVDTTASTPIPVDERCRPLAEQSAFKQNLNAQAWLWKDHTAQAEAAEITALVRDRLGEWLPLCGGTYSSEWFWSKILHCRRVDPRVADAAYTWLEQCDYVVALLTGCTDPRELRRSVCAAGHKGLYHHRHGLPPADVLARLDPVLEGLRERMYERAYTSDEAAGRLAADWARKLGVPRDVPVAVGAIDAHLGAVGAGIGPGTLVKIIGTSACDMIVTPPANHLPDIPGVCGVVDGSIIPGQLGIEAGQPAVGDLLNWWTARIDRRRNAHELLTSEAGRLRAGQSGLLALDWNNGNRSILVDARLGGLLIGQTLQTTPAEIYRALIEATAFGARVIIDQLEEHGVGVEQILASGGVAEKNPLLMQIYADVTGRPIHAAKSTQTCALGAAICGAVASGVHANVPAAQQAMCPAGGRAIKPRSAEGKVYDTMYVLYRRLHDAFGVAGSGVAVERVMKELIDLREETARSR